MDQGYDNPLTGIRALTIIYDDDTIETLASGAHDSWMESNRANGVTTAISRLTGEEQMVPYEDLSEQVKEYDRQMVRGVITGLRAMIERAPPYTNGP